MSRLIVGAGVAARPKAWGPEIFRAPAIFFACDQKVLRGLGGETARALRQLGSRVSVYPVAGGEDAKSWDALRKMVAAMSRAGLGRDAVLVAMGGGTVTDAAGFAAAIYLRGIPWISVPTTLLGQLDGGIGGKVAINLAAGKNLVGAFHQPSAVVCDLDALKTLPVRERAAGLAEAVKCGLVFEPALFRFIEARWADLLRGEEKATARVIRAAAGWKLKIVAQDERETLGPRELLNFGHTLGHALETASGHGRLRHGEAVVWGMRAALTLSRRAAGFSSDAAAENFLSRQRVPLPRGLSARRILEIARRDKKARGGKLRFILLKRLGAPVVKSGIADRIILRTIEELL